METERKQNDDIVRLRSSDGKIFDVEEAVALQSTLIKKLAKDIGAENPIPLPAVSSHILEKIIEYCRYHVHHPPRPVKSADDGDQWDVDFVNVDVPTLFQLGQAAHYLDIISLIDLVARTIANVITRWETPEKVREMLNIQNDLTPEEQQRIESQFPWK
jgi:S-phase kinase-associated protein 1